MSVKYICSMFKIQLRKMFLFVRFCLLVSFGSFFILSLFWPAKNVLRQANWVGGINQRKGEHIWTYYRYGKLFIYLTEILTSLTQHMKQTKILLLQTEFIHYYCGAIHCSYTLKNLLWPILVNYEDINMMHIEIILHVQMA